jgi:hypothetical protein
MNYEQKYLKYKSKYLELKNQTSTPSLLGGAKYDVGDVVEFKHEGKIVEIINSSENISYKIEFFDTVSQSNKNVLIFEDKILSKNEQSIDTLEKTQTSKAITPTQGVIIPTSMQLILASSEEQINLNNFLIDPMDLELDLNLNKYNLVSSGRITADKKPLEMNGIIIKFSDENYDVFAIRCGNYDDEQIQLGLTYLIEENNSKNNVKLSWQTEKNFIQMTEDRLKTNEEIKKNEYKYLIIGSFSGEIGGKINKKIYDGNKLNIFIDRFDAGSLPRGGGNNMLCLFINYLKNFNKSYDKNSIFNVELQNTTPENFKAYQKMGFVPCSDEVYCNDKTATMKLDIDLFNTKCKDFSNSVTLYT